MLTSIKLIALSASALSLLFSYFPKLNSWYAALTEDAKKGLMLAWLAVVTLIVFGLGCVPEIVAQFGSSLDFVSCSAQGAWDLAFLFFEAVAFNQGTYRLTPTTTAVRAAKSNTAKNVK